MRHRPSAVDQRRLDDGARALWISGREPSTIDDVRAQIEVVDTGIAALQSLDDLGPEINQRALHDLDVLWKRRDALKRRLASLESKES